MKVQTQPNLNQWRFSKTLVAAVLALATTVPTLFGASQTWTNAPVTGDWTNILNWVGKAVPGALNPGANSLSADTVTFLAPLAGGIGGTAVPVNNDTNRNVKFVLFDTTNCGAYVVGNIDSNILQVTATAYPGGNITVAAGVTNPQVINAPMLTRLASSSSGGFSFINNSSNLNATLTIANITNSSASSRPMTFFLDGSNTGSNVVGHIGNNNGANGAILVTKQGAGTWVLTSANDLPQKTSTPTVGSGVAAISVNAGKLIVRDAGALGAITAANLIVTNTGVLQIDGVTLNNAGIGLKSGGTIRMNGSGTVNGVTVGNQSALSATVATTSASDVLTVGNAVNKLTGGAADSVLHLAGPGTVLLAFDANYIGKVAIDAGTNQLGAGTTLALGTGASTTIAAGAVLDLTPLGAVTYVLSTAALGGSGTGTTVGTTAATITADAAATIDLATGTKGISLTITPTAFTGDTTHPALYVAQGTLALGGNAFSINNASGTALGAGTYRLISQASGGVTDGGGYSVVGVTGSGLVSGNVASIQVSGGNVNLIVSAYVPKNLVWTGGALNANWNLATDANWLNGVAPIIFNNSDNVTFNSVGATNPTVTLVSTLAPSSVTVDTAANNYAFSGSGSLAGSAALVKKSSGTLVLGTVNTYGGGTVVSNGVLQITANNAVSATGAGDVAISSAGKFDLNGFNNAINGLNGNGSVDITSGGASTLSVGNNNNSGTFAGSLLNTSGSLSLTKNGTGTQILSGSNNYSGATTINVGSLRVTDRNALGAGASAVTVNGGTLDVSTNVLVASLAGNGTIANNSTASTNTVTLQAGSAFGGTIADGAGGGGLAVLVSSGTLSLNAANSYSGGTIVASGAGLVIGSSGSAGAGGIIASNSTRVGFANTGNPSGFAANNLTTVDNASVLVTGGGNQANNLAFQFFGSATATNVYTNACSMGGVSSFANFFGTAVFTTSASVRFFNALGGGDGTTFDFQGGSIFSRDNNTIRLGALQGGTATTGIFGPSVSFPATFIIGAKGLNTVYSGVLSGSNNVVKAGAGSLTFDGAVYTVTTDSATYTNTLYTAGTITYLNNTTVSNGTLSLVVPNNLNNSPNLTLAGAGAVLNVSKMGYITNLLSIDDNTTPTNSLLVTNGILELLTATPNGTPQTLAGLGTIAGKLLADAGSTITLGLPIGTLSVTNGITLNGATVNVDVNRTNSQISDQLAATGAPSLTVNGGTLTLTNLGPDLITGDVFHVFNKASVGNFAITNLPTSNALNTVAYVWTNKLAIDGTLVLLQGASAVNTSPTNLIASVSGNTLSLSWPADHTGWKLQIQTNGLSVGLNTNWVTLPGSDLVNSTNLTINPANGAVFYRMVYP